MTTIITQDYIRFADIFNVKWTPEVPNSCHSRGTEGFNDSKIAWRNNQPIEWTDEKVDKVFSECAPKGLDTEIMSILDKGYTIFVKDSGMNVRKIWIEKVDSNNKSLGRGDQILFARGLQIADVLKIGLKLFKETLAVDKPYNYDDWFGSDKLFAAYVTGGNVADSRLDALFVIATAEMIFRKAQNGGYELEFTRDDIKKPTIIRCSKFSIA